MNKNKIYNCDGCEETKDNLENVKVVDAKDLESPGMLQDPALVRYYDEVDNRTFYIDFEFENDIEIKRLMSIGRMITKINLDDRKVQKNLLQPIILFIHSGGGDLDSAMYLCDLIKSSRVPVYTVVMGNACSAASLIAMSGHKRYCFKHSYYMIHEGDAMFGGTAVQVKDFSSHYTYMLSKIRKFIVDNTKITTKQLEEKLNNDWYINGGYVLKYGLADKMINSIEEVFNEIYKDFDVLVNDIISRLTDEAGAEKSEEYAWKEYEDFLENPGEYDLDDDRVYSFPIDEEVIKIKYLSDKIDKLKYIDGKSDWIDLRAAEDITMKAGEFKLIPLGVAMKLPEGYEAYIVPRSSTYKNFGIIQTNSCGIVDGSYCGDNDQWMMPAYALRDTEIKTNDRICQFRIYLNQPRIKFKELKRLGNKNRGGIGSTGKN